ncbi:phosphoribulokinase [Coralliovum pocilloporae]|uniref:phosphoribulokinase n=1 Tax=Coralliovum pocilloporae TaxID=3066369 RepID=UPI003306FB6D
MMIAAKRTGPVILGIVGDSGVGKTTLARGIARILGPERVTIFSMDDYHRYTRAERYERQLSALEPDCNHLDILTQHLKLLRKGEAVLKPVYDHTNGELVRPELMQPADFIIAEGLLGYASRELRSCYDVKIFLEPEEDLRLRWKIHRDTTQRGYSQSDVLSILERRQRARDTYIVPQRLFADIVIRFVRPAVETGQQDDQLDACHVLRPTLPHPDFTSLLDSIHADRDIRLQLTRDHGKPVDLLEISGGISPERASDIERYLWSELQDAKPDLDDVGLYESSVGMRVSHPLALTQLFIAIHMMKAAQGEYAI